MDVAILVTGLGILASVIVAAFRLGAQIGGLKKDVGALAKDNKRFEAKLGNLEDNHLTTIHQRIDALGEKFTDKIDELREEVVKVQTTCAATRARYDAAIKNLGE